MTCPHCFGLGYDASGYTCTCVPPAVVAKVGRRYYDRAPLRGSSWRRQIAYLAKFLIGCSVASVLAALVLATLTLTGCQPAPEPKVKAYNDYAPPSKDRMTVQLVWMDDPTKYCALREGTLRNGGESYLGCAAVLAKGTVCEVVMRKPKNFNDGQTLEVLGHELMHCLGARHE